VDCDSKTCQRNLLELKRQLKNLLSHVERLEGLLLEKSGTTSDELELAKRLRGEYMTLGATPKISDVKRLSKRLDKEWGGIDLDEASETSSGHDDMDVDEPVPITHYPMDEPSSNLPPDAVPPHDLTLDVPSSHPSTDARSASPPRSLQHAISGSPNPPAALYQSQAPADASSPISSTGLGDSD
jgi:hypothetical protein